MDYDLAHGLSVDDIVMISAAGTYGEPYLLYGVYYVVRVPSTTTLVLSNTLSGTPLQGTSSS